MKNPNWLNLSVENRENQNEKQGVNISSAVWFYSF